MKSPIVSNVRFRAAQPLDAQAGLLGWVMIDVGRLQIDGIAVRRQRDQRLSIVYPAHRGRSGAFHPIFFPLDAADRAAIEEQVLAQLQHGGAI